VTALLRAFKPLTRQLKQLHAAHTHKKQSIDAGTKVGQGGGIVGVRASGNEAADAASLAARAVRAVTGSAGKEKLPAKPPANFEAAKSTSKQGGKQRGEGEGESRPSKAAGAGGGGAASGAVNPRGISRSERELEKQLADLEAFEHRPPAERQLQHLQAFRRMSDLKRYQACSFNSRIVNAESS
jgi:hypothetical protein